MEFDDEYRKALDRYRDDAKSLGPDEYYRHVRERGCNRLIAFLLLRDLYGKNLFDAAQIELDAGPIDEIHKVNVSYPSKFRNRNTKI
jgi:hypothetical protein